MYTGNNPNSRSIWEARAKHKVSNFYITWKLLVCFRTTELWPQWIWKADWCDLRQIYFCAREVISQGFEGEVVFPFSWKCLCASDCLMDTKCTKYVVVIQGTTGSEQSQWIVIFSCYAKSLQFTISLSFVFLFLLSCSTAACKPVSCTQFKLPSPQRGVTKM